MLGYICTLIKLIELGNYKIISINFYKSNIIEYLKTTLLRNYSIDFDILIVCQSDFNKSIRFSKLINYIYSYYIKFNFYIDIFNFLEFLNEFKANLGWGDSQMIKLCVITFIIIIIVILFIYYTII